jgi:hypothetical protein
MFTNLTLKGFTWPREPVLYLALLVAIVNTVTAVLEGGLSWGEAIDAVVIAIGAFVARGQVTPV